VEQGHFSLLFWY